MPLSDLLGEVATLSQIQHQHLADQLAAKVADANITNATEAIMAALPQDSRQDFLTAQTTGDWSNFTAHLPNSVDTIRTLVANGRSVQGVDPLMAREITARALAGEGAGDVAKSGLEQKMYTGAAGSPLMDDATFHAQVLTHLATGGGLGSMATDTALATTPGLAQHAASDAAGVTIPATSKAQIALQASVAQAGDITENRKITAQERMAALSDNTDLLKARIASHAGATSKDLEWVDVIQKAVTELSTGTKQKTEQFAMIGVINQAVRHLAASGSLSPQEAEAYTIDPNGKDAPGQASKLARQFGWH
jgi:hypothetical protein